MIFSVKLLLIFAKFHMEELMYGMMITIKKFKQLTKLP